MYWKISENHFQMSITRFTLLPIHFLISFYSRFIWIEWIIILNWYLKLDISPINLLYPLMIMKILGYNSTRLWLFIEFEKCFNVGSFISKINFLVKFIRGFKFMVDVLFDFIDSWYFEIAFQGTIHKKLFLCKVFFNKIRKDPWKKITLIRFFFLISFQKLSKKCNLIYFLFEQKVKKVIEN